MGINRDYSGAVKIDGIDLREINLRHLRQSFGVVLQENFLFRGTVKDNILAGRPGLSFEDAVRAARLAGAEEFIERLPQGYETWIEEGSPNLSGGQRQRLAIARALIVDPKLMILDEATSALDPESEALINANLQRMARGRTMVIVSHRLSSLVDCDQTLVLDRGEVVDLGPHRELVERCAIYRHLWLQQNRHIDFQGKAHAAPAPDVRSQTTDGKRAEARACCRLPLSNSKALGSDHRYARAAAIARDQPLRLPVSRLDARRQRADPYRQDRLGQRQARRRSAQYRHTAFRPVHR